MPETKSAGTSLAQRRLDRQLLLSLMLSPLAAGISTIVGFSVAHWITITAYKRSGYFVSLLCLALCGAAALLAWDAHHKVSGSDDTIPIDGRQFFMAQLSLLLSGLCALVVVAGILVLIILRPDA
jgi:uncharacterized membrane protein YiaA